jgi:hypothetical protein
VIGDVSGGANGSRAAAVWQRGGAAVLAPEDPTDGCDAHGGDPQSGRGDDGAGGGAENPVTPDP